MYEEMMYQFMDNMYRYEHPRRRLYDLSIDSSIAPTPRRREIRRNMMDGKLPILSKSFTK